MNWDPRRFSWIFLNLSGFTWIFPYYFPDFPQSFQIFMDFPAFSGIFVAPSPCSLLTGNNWDPPRFFQILLDYFPGLFSWIILLDYSPGFSQIPPDFPGSHQVEKNWDPPIFSWIIFPNFPGFSWVIFPDFPSTQPQFPPDWDELGSSQIFLDFPVFSQISPVPSQLG